MNYKQVFVVLVMIFLPSCSPSLGEDEQVDTAFLTGAYIGEFNELDLSDKELTRIPNFEKYLTGSYKYDVWSINLQGNTIEKVNSDFLSFFPNLKELNLSYNQIQELNLSDLPIEKLLAHKNEIEKIDISSLEKLKELNLGYNNLAYGKDIQLPSNIQILELQHNKLEDIQGIQILENLKTLKLEFNALEDTDMVVLKDLKNLSFISVAYNKLSEELEKGFLNFNEVMKESQK